MSEYQVFLQERNRIDFLIEKGFKITNVVENLNGSYVEFEKNGEDDEKEVLHIATPEGRKYFTVILIQQQKLEMSNGGG